MKSSRWFTTVFAVFAALGLSLVATTPAEASARLRPVVIESGAMNATIFGSAASAAGARASGAQTAPQASVARVACVGSQPTVFVTFSAGTAQHMISVIANAVTVRTITAKAGSYRTVSIPIKSGAPTWVQPAIDKVPTGSLWYGIVACSGNNALVASVYGVDGGCQVSYDFSTKSARSDLTVKADSTSYSDTLFKGDELANTVDAAIGIHTVAFTTVDTNGSGKTLKKTAWKNLAPLYFNCSVTG